MKELDASDNGSDALITFAYALTKGDDVPVGQHGRCFSSDLPREPVSGFPDESAMVGTKIDEVCLGR